MFQCFQYDFDDGKENNPKQDFETSTAKIRQQKTVDEMMVRVIFVFFLSRDYG